jgi:hypothetical protein
MRHCCSATVYLQAVLQSADELVWERGVNKQVNLQGATAVDVQYAFHS